MARRAALLFTSGYVSNGRRSRRWARGSRTAVILSDSLNHNSMIEGDPPQPRATR
jgi:7-keto-8-aminopelargonate synthetase-like enzyme